MSRTRALAVAAMSLIGVAAFMPAASAVRPLTITSSGTQSRQVNYVVAVNAKGTGVFKTYVPNTSLRETNDHGSADYTTTYFSGYRSVSWKVTEDGGYMDDTGTYACVDDARKLDSSDA